ncbi:MAG: sporulation initiation factor Spo0A C-terminal domain-containing protein [Clostridia bacterium]|nr:sporulation initiation factor Spo0A C-terminal domain-containing protein [Clostridia bacterium]
MDTNPRRALAAGFTPGSGSGVERALSEAGFTAVEWVPDAEGALRRIRDLQPELVVAAAVLPGTDGVGFARRVRALRLDVRPALLIQRFPGLALPGASRLEALAAAEVDRPLTAEALRSALEALKPRLNALPPRLEARLESLLDALGVPRHPGRDCLSRAVSLAWADRRRLRALRDALYVPVAREMDLSPAQVERAMRHAIEVAWRTGEIEQQHRIFGDTIDARRGKPTCGEMIAQLADILRWEG